MNTSVTMYNRVQQIYVKTDMVLILSSLSISTQIDCVVIVCLVCFRKDMN